MTQTTEKWDSMVSSKADFWMLWSCHGIPCFHFSFLFRSNSKKNTRMRSTFVTVMVLFQKRHFGGYLISAIFKILNNCEAHWQQHLKDTLQLKILQTWINMRINSFLDKYDETKMNEGALEIISRIKIWACSLKNIAPSHFTYYCILLFLWNKDSFQIQPSVDRIFFSKTCLLFYL